jgi:hypothetical protein
MAHVDIYLFRSRANIASEVTRQAQYTILLGSTIGLTVHTKHTTLTPGTVTSQLSLAPRRGAFHSCLHRRNLNPVIWTLFTSVLNLIGR